jgi:hypothetical protein
MTNTWLRDSISVNVDSSIKRHAAEMKTTKTTEGQLPRAHKQRVNLEDDVDVEGTACQSGQQEQRQEQVQVQVQVQEPQGKCREWWRPTDSQHPQLSGVPDSWFEQLPM